MKRNWSVKELKVLAYGSWIVLIVWGMATHWIAPLIIFALGAVLLHNSPFGGPLREIIRWVQQVRTVDLRRAQQLTFGAGFVVAAMGTQVVAIANKQARERQYEVQQQEELATRKREAAALAETKAAQAKADAERAVAERLNAERLAAQAKADAQQKAQEADRQAAQDRADAQQRAQEAEQARRRQVEQDAQAKQDADQKKAEERQAAQDTADAEVARRIAEGPYTGDNVEDMCKTAIGQKLGVNESELIQHGSLLQQLNAMPWNTRFGDRHLWFWRPTFALVNTQELFQVLCRVEDDGEVAVMNP